MAKQPLENVVKHLFQIAAQAEFKTLSDSQLLQRYIDNRDELAFGELVRRNEAMVWNACWRVLGQRQDTEDVFQATFMTLFRQAAKIRSHASIEGWLHHVTCKLAHNSKRSRVRRQVLQERTAKMSQESYEEDHFRRECGEVLDKELICIPEKYRTPLILCYLKGLTWGEASQRLGISLNCLEWRLEEGRKRLKQRLSKYGMEWSPMMMMAHPVPGVDVPHVPPGLVEKTLEIVRVMALSNGALQTAGISPQVALLVKGTMGMTLKMKLLLGSLLLSSLMVVTAGAAKYAGVLHLLLNGQKQKGKPKTANQTPEEPKPEKAPPRVDRYGDPLPPGALDRLGTVRFRHNEEAIKSIIVTPDKTNPIILAKAHFGNSIRLWDLTTGKPLYQFRDSQGEVIPFTTTRESIWNISFDGRLFAKCDKPGEEFRFWDMSTCKLLNLRLKGYPEFLAISSDGKTVTEMGVNRYLRGWDSTTGMLRWEYRKENYWYTHLVYSTDGKTLMSLARRRGTVDNNKNTVVCRWDAATGKKLAPWSIADNVTEFAWSRDGSVLAVRQGSTGNIVELWNMDMGKKVQPICVEGKIAQPNIRLAISPDGKILATGTLCQDAKGKLCLWNTTTGQRLRDCTNQGSWPGQLAFSCDGKTLVSTSVNDHTIQIYEVNSGKQVNQEWLKRGYCDEVDSVAFSPHSETLVSTTGVQAQNSLGLWDTRAEAGLDPFRPLIPGFNSDGRGHFSVALSPDGKTAASFVLMYGKNIRQCGMVRAWEIATHRELLINDHLPCVAGELSFSPNGKFLACTLEGNRTTVWEVATGKQLVANIVGRAITFFPDGKMLITHTKKEGLYIRETATGKKLYCLQKDQFDDFRKIALSPDGQILAVIGNIKDNTDAMYGHVCLWPVEVSKHSVRLGTPRLLPKCAATGSRRGGFSFSSDSRMIALSDSATRPTIVVLELVTGQERCHFSDRSLSSLNRSTLSFSPDNRRLASGHTDTTILIWDLTGRLDGERLRSARLSVQEMKARWADLASPEAARAARALWSLVAAGSPTVSFLARRLRPIHQAPVPAETLTKLIADLDHNVFAVRKKAREELKKMGETAETSLRQALDKKPSLELRRSIEELLKAVEQDRNIVVPPTLGVLRTLRAIEVLEQIGTLEARQLLGLLSQGTARVRQTLEAGSALRRLQRKTERQ